MALVAGSFVADGKRYSPFDPDEVHADLRIDAVTTRRNMMKSQDVMDKHRDCAECMELATAARASASRRVQFRFTAGELADLLGLPADQRVVRMFVYEEPHMLVLVVEGAAFDEVPDEREALVATLRP